MKITDIKTFLMHVGVPAPKAWASDNAFGSQSYSPGITGTRNWLFVKVYTDEGLVGIGECSGWPRVIETAVQDLKRLLVGEDPTHIERLWQRMMSAIMVHGLTGTVGAG
ncbi:MAG: mandelate racemase/muconate lactonizing enzyme family protein, partial [Burkholderiales bacterium]|nr:mandelate racemase/muconate lactonizing enzyme family protein [Burkholderiales bacterium]